MHGFPLGGLREELTGLERENEGSCVQGNASSKHVEKEGECRGGNSRFVVASDHGVPHEGVGFGDTADETVGVADVAGVGEGAEREALLRGKVSLMRPMTVMRA